MINYREIRRIAERLQFSSRAKGGHTARLDVRLDASLSMTSGDGSKEQLARELSILFLELCADNGLTGSVCAVRGTDRIARIDAGRATPLAHVPFDGIQWGPELLAHDDEGPESGALRLVISDFLFPDDPGPLVRRLATGAEQLWLLQVLDEQELNPEPADWARLVDIETEETLDLVLDRSTIDAYLARMARLRERLQEACRAVRASLVTGSAAGGLDRFSTEQLVPAGLLELRPASVMHPPLGEDSW